MASAYARLIDLGVRAEELLKAVLKVKDKDIKFKASCFLVWGRKAYLERLNSTLERVIPRIEEAKRLDADVTVRQRNDIGDLIGQLRKGQELIRKCSKIHSFNFYQKCRYSKQFLKLETIIRFFQLDMQVDMWRNTQQLLTDVKRMSRKFDGMNLRDGGGSDESPNNVVGLDVPLEELKMELLRKDRPKADCNEIIDQLQRGKEFVSACSKIHPLNYYQKYLYWKKILKLEETIIRFFQLDMQLDMWHDTKQLLVDVKQVRQKFDGMDRRDGGGGTAIRIGSKGSCAVPEIPDHVVGFDAPLKELRTELFRDDVTVLGLCAPGGCGKTTLASMLCQDEQVRGRFKNIFFITVSSSPNLKLIIQRLVEQMAFDVPKFLNDEDAVKKFGDLLKQRKKPEPILLVLDDVRMESIIVQKLLFKTEGFKILVTSRSKVETFDSNYSLKMLGHQDAMTLFRHAALPQDGNENYVPDEDLLDKIVRGCKGCPLTLEVIAHSLRCEPARKWRSIERKLSKGCFIFDSHRDSLDRLQTAYIS